jgi:Cof subfamily protein (haloacid dehalogenase superfamily)
MIRLVAFDLDGTLMDSHQVIRTEVRRAISATLERGVIVTLATGRMFSATVPFARDLGITAPLICYQGGWIQAPGAPLLYRAILPDHEARRAIALGAAQGWHTTIFIEGQLYIDAEKHPRRYYEQMLGPDPIVEPDLASLLPGHTADKVLYVAEAGAIPGITARLTDELGDAADIIQSHANFIEVVPKDVSKGNALAWLAAQMEIPREAVLAAGDQHNDLSMVTWAGTGVAMGNAVAEVIAAADWAAPSLEQGGAAAILERYVLSDQETQ